MMTRTDAMDRFTVSARQWGSARTTPGLYGVALLVAIALAGPVAAQDSLNGAFDWLRKADRNAAARTVDDDGTDADTPNDADADAEDEKDDADDDRYFAITGGRVHTVSGPVLHDATILCKNGKIIDIGMRVKIPDDAEILDAAGHRVYPGLVAMRSFGILGSDPPNDSTDVYSLSNVAALAAGITTTVTGSTAAKVTFGTIENIVIKSTPFVGLRYSTSNPRGRQQLRQQFDRLVEHMRKVEDYERRKAAGEDVEEPDSRWIRGQLANYQRLLEHEAVALISADSVHDLLQICELVDRYGIRVVVEGAREGWIVAPELARAGVSAIVSPRVRSDPDDRYLRPTGSAIENAAILHRHGVPVAIVPARPSLSFGGLAGRDLAHLPMEAAFGVRGGLPEDAAVRSITLEAAKMLGVDHRVGSIDVGKDADFIITDGDLLHYMTHVRWAVVNGQIMYDKLEESLYDHIRPDGDLDPPPPNDHWPRRLGAEW